MKVVHAVWLLVLAKPALAIEVEQLPEPGSMALFGAGAVVIGLLGLRRKLRK